MSLFFNFSFPLFCSLSSSILFSHIHAHTHTHTTLMSSLAFIKQKEKQWCLDRNAWPRTVSYFPVSFFFWKNIRNRVKLNQIWNLQAADIAYNLRSYNRIPIMGKDKLTTICMLSVPLFFYFWFLNKSEEGGGVIIHHHSKDWILYHIIK